MDSRLRIQKDIKRFGRAKCEKCSLGYGIDPHALTFASRSCKPTAPSPWQPTDLYPEIGISGISLLSVLTTCKLSIV